MESYSFLYSSAQRTKLLSGFQRLRCEGKMCDVLLETGGTSFPCHRALLASSSDYFWALFGDTTAERWAASISLPALTPDGLGAILDFLYSGWLQVSSGTLPDILEAARYLQVDPAVAICERFIIDCLSCKNCCCYANLAAHHSLSGALEAANQTVTMEMSNLLNESRGDLLGLNMESMMALLDTDEISLVKEVDLMKLALDWLNENGPLPLLKSNLLLSRLRFGLVSPTDLNGISHKAMSTPLIRSQLTRALEYHEMGLAKPIRQNRQTTIRASPDRVLLVGGGSSSESPEQDMLSFDPKNLKFSSLSTKVPLRLRDHCVCSVGGFLFVVGGEEVTEGNADGKTLNVKTSNQVWRFDPRFDCWEQMESMLDQRAQFSCCVVQDVIYVMGGRQTHAGTLTSVSSVEFYDMTFGAWRRGPHLPYRLHGHASTAFGDSIYLSGGLQGHHSNIDIRHGEDRVSSKDLLRWNPNRRVWDKMASMSIGRCGHRLATIGCYIYALLGMYEPFCDIERYDRDADRWTRLRPLLNGSFSYGMVPTSCGSILVFGGRRWSEGQEVIARGVLEYDPKKDQWKEICQLPRPLTGTECTLLPLPD